MTENTISTFTFDFPLTFALASCENYLPHYTLCYTYHLVFCSCFSAKVCFKLQSDSFAFSFALRSVFKQTHRAVMWVNTWFMSWKCSIKSFWKRASFYVLCLILAMCLMSLMCHSVLCSRTHKKVSTPLLRFFFFFFFSPLNLSLSLFLCLPVWVEFNRVLWCERDVSLKNIRHQRSLLRWSGISRWAYSAHSLGLVSSTLWARFAVSKK